VSRKPSRGELAESCGELHKIGEIQPSTLPVQQIAPMGLPRCALSATGWAMKLCMIAARVASMLLLLCACDRDTRDKPISGKPQAGGFYSFNDGEGGFRAGKVVAVDDITFVRLYKERWTKRPSLAEARQATKPVSVAYSFETIEAMQPVLLEMEKVTPEELTAYDQWKQTAQEVF
jgi:hypothetical protein